MSKQFHNINKLAREVSRAIRDSTEDSNIGTTELTWATKPTASAFGKNSAWFSDIDAMGYSDNVKWTLPPGLDTPTTSAYVGVNDPLSNKRSIQRVIDQAGVGATIKFNPNIEYVLRGRLVPLSGQEWLDLNIKRCNQITDSFSGTISDSSVSIVVSDATKFQIGDTIAFVDTISSANPVKTSTFCADIWKIVTATNTIYFTNPSAFLGVQTVATGVTTTIASGYVITMGPLIGNRPETGQSTRTNILSDFKLTRVVINGNRTNNATGLFWDLAVDIDLICDNATIYKPRITNGCGEGIMFGGDNFDIIDPYIDGMNGNGLHPGAYGYNGGTSGVNVGRVLGGYIANTNDAPLVSGSAGTITYNATTALAGLPVKATQDLVGAVLKRTDTGVIIGTVATQHATDGTGALAATTAQTGAIATSISNIGAVVNRFANRKQNGHIGGCITVSNNVYDLTIQGVQLFNGYNGIGEIDSIDNSRITITGCSVSSCGTYGVDEGQFKGAFEISNNGAIGPRDIIITKNYVEDCYSTVIGKNNITNANACTVSMSQNTFVNTEVRFGSIKTLNHTDGKYIGKGIVLFNDRINGNLDGVNVQNPTSIGIECYSGEPTGYPFTLNNFSISNAQYGINLHGGGVFWGIIGAGIISTTTGGYINGTDNPSDTVGIIIGGGGGYQTLNSDIVGSVLIDIADNADAGVHLYPIPSVSFNNKSFNNLTIKMRGSGTPIKVSATASNFSFVGLSTYPAQSTASWPATVTAPGKITLTSP